MISRKISPTLKNKLVVLAFKNYNLSTEAKENYIGVPGTMGFGIGIYPTASSPLPEGFSEMEGTRIVGHTNYGNYQYKDGSVMCWIPKFYFKWSTGNVIEIASDLDYENETEAEKDNFLLHRAFIDGGVIKTGFFYDKYFNSIGYDLRPVSVRGGIPFNFNPDSPYSYPNINIMFPQNSHLIEFSKRRGKGFFTTSIYMHGALAFLSLAHGIASTEEYHCAWYGNTSTRFPKGCNNNELGDTNDRSIKYDPVEEGSPMPKTGTGFPFAKTTHNGQDSGIADLNGCRNEKVIGYTQISDSYNDDRVTGGDSDTGFLLKDIIKISELTGLWGRDNGEMNAFGPSSHIGALYDRLGADSFRSLEDLKYGNGEVEVFRNATFRSEQWLGYCAGLPFNDNSVNSNGTSTSGTSKYGTDEYNLAARVANCSARVGGTYDSTTKAGIFAMNMAKPHFDSTEKDGYRCAYYA